MLAGTLLAWHEFPRCMFARLFPLLPLLSRRRLLVRWDRHGFLDLKYAHTFTDDTELTARAFYDRYNYDGDYMIEIDEPSVESRYDSHQMSYDWANQALSFV